MPRIPEAEIERLKEAVSVQRLVESSACPCRFVGQLRASWQASCPGDFARDTRRGPLEFAGNGPRTPAIIT